MARSGGRGGGSRSSGSRSSGSRSSGSRSSSSRSFSSSPRSNSSPSRSSYTNISIGNNNRGGYYYRPGYRRSSGRFNLTFFLIIVIIVIVAITASFLSSWVNANPANSRAREPLKTSNIHKHQNMIHDEVRLFSNTAKVNNALANFRDKTGVEIHVLTMDYFDNDARADVIMDEMFDSDFKDEQHAILLFAWHRGSEDYVMYWRTGAAAKDFMDEEAWNLLADIMDYHYHDHASYDDIFIKAFNTASKRLLTKTVHPGIVVAVVFGLVAVLTIVCVSLNRKRALKVRDSEAAAAILAAPVDTLNGGDRPDPLASKYDGMD